MYWILAILWTVFVGVWISKQESQYKDDLILVCAILFVSLVLTPLAMGIAIYAYGNNKL